MWVLSVIMTAPQSIQSHDECLHHVLWSKFCFKVLIVILFCQEFPIRTQLQYRKSMHPLERTCSYHNITCKVTIMSLTCKIPCTCTNQVQAKYKPCTKSTKLLKKNFLTIILSTMPSEGLYHPHGYKLVPHVLFLLLVLLLMPLSV